MDIFNFKAVVLLTFKYFFKKTQQECSLSAIEKKFSMPVNLNALIRYKTINSCLYGGVRKYDIQELIEACSNAVSESRGRYCRISERTIRDDIRVMRSDILGFNAPIVQHRGLYFYSDPNYTILSVGICDPGILQMVIKSLMRISNDVKHPELEIIIEKLRMFSPESFEYDCSEESISLRKISEHKNSAIQTGSASVKFILEDSINYERPLKDVICFRNKMIGQIIWEDVMKAF